jgi:hypothetical protein
MDIIDVFVRYMDDIYYEGYAYQLAQDNPTAYQYELNQFLNNHNFEQ